MLCLIFLSGCASKAHNIYVPSTYIPPERPQTPSFVGSRSINCSTPDIENASSQLRECHKKTAEEIDGLMNDAKISTQKLRNLRKELEPIATTPIVK